MRRLALLLLIQGLLVAVYLLVERGRAPQAPFAAERLDQPAPALVLEGQQGAVDLATRQGQAVLVHFWATWCAPCRTELPLLLAAARDHDVVLLAVTDEPWDVVGAYFGGQVPPEILRDPGGAAAAAFGVSALPDTVVVRGPRVVGRVGGARDWSTRGAGQFLDGLSAE